MKAIFLVFFCLLIIFPISTSADMTTICLVCKGIIVIPDSDDEAQILLKLACDSVENSILAGACRSLASAIHKTNTWPAFKWFLDSIKGLSCSVLCPE